MYISESTGAYSFSTYPKPIAFPQVGDIVPEVTLPIQALSSENIE